MKRSLAELIVPVIALVLTAPLASQAEDAIFPSLAPLSGVTHKQVVDAVMDRREQSAALSANEKEADAAILSILGDFKVFESAEGVRKIAADAIAAVRRRAQVDLERQAFIGMSKDLPSATGAVTAMPRSNDSFIEIPLWHASLLRALGDAPGSDQLISYWGLPTDSVQAIASFLTSDAGKKQGMLADISNRVAADEKDPTASYLAIAVHRRKLAVSPEMQDQAVAVIRASKAPLSVSYLTGLESKQRVEATKNQIGSPFAISGQLTSGTMFSTTELKGKVILVDFWATWCGPCVAEFPKLKKFYAQYRDQGFEIVGVTNDFVPGALDKYLAANPDVNWPQLADPTATAMQEMNPIARKFGVSLLPTMFLIDRNGILRSISARSEYEKLIPSLLAEPVK